MPKIDTNADNLNILAFATTLSNVSLTVNGENVGGIKENYINNRFATKGANEVEDDPTLSKMLNELKSGNLSEDEAKDVILAVVQKMYFANGFSDIPNIKFENGISEGTDGARGTETGTIYLDIEKIKTAMNDKDNGGTGVLIGLIAHESSHSEKYGETTGNLLIEEGFADSKEELARDKFKETDKTLSEAEKKEALAKIKEEVKDEREISDNLVVSSEDEEVEADLKNIWKEIKKEVYEGLKKNLKKLGFSEEKTMAVAGYLTACNVENKVAGSSNQIMQGNSASYRTNGVLTIDEYAKKYKISKEELKLLKEYEKSEQNITTINLFSQAIALTMAGNQFAKWEKAGSGTNNFKSNGGVLENANFAQKTYNSNKFSNEGIEYYSKIAGKKIINVEDLTNAIKNGNISISDIPVDYIVRDGKTLILNTRTSQALIKAGIPREQWKAVNRTNQSLYENMLTDQLKRNKLTSEGVNTVKPSQKK